MKLNKYILKSDTIFRFAEDYEFERQLINL